MTKCKCKCPHFIYETPAIQQLPANALTFKESNFLDKFGQNAQNKVPKAQTDYYLSRYYKTSLILE